ncbi:MAG: formylmethanofuran dehydrogenase subunit B, partial [Betaproteobacteria bacterium]
SAGTDVAGMRALVELAERCRGIVDHANRAALFRNLRVLQDTGWISTTLTEVRNRADLLVIAGSGIDNAFPRLFERCFGAFETLFDTGARELIILGDLPENLPAALKRKATCLPVESQRLAEVFAALRMLLANRRIPATTVAGLSVAQLGALLARMRAAKYGVIAWAAAQLEFAHADLAVQSMCDFVRELNVSTRFSVLPLGGSDGDLTALQVTTWQTGFPVGVDFGGGMPSPAESREPLNSLNGDADVDALVFVSAIDPARTPPAANVPSIVIGRAGMQAGQCDVFIPVGVPGLHHAGHLFRTDSVVALRMRQIAACALPAAGDVLRQLLRALEAH